MEPIKTDLAPQEQVPLMFFGGEFHYWRTPPDAWEEVFRSIRKLGFNGVSTYVPWDFHETAPRRYDFTGRTSPAKNLLRWLQLAKNQGLRVVLRPGPYIYAEWNHKGPPGRLAKFPRLSKPFLGGARHWIGAVGRAVSPYLATNGGPIVAVQVCNEVTGMFEFDHYTDPKVGRIEEIYRRWAKRKSARLPRFPFQWGGSHLDVPKGRQKEARSLLAFNAWYTTEYIRRMADIFRAARIDVPLFANLVSWWWPQNWSALQDHVDFVAMDSYYPNLLPGDLPAAFAGMYRHFSGVSKHPFAAEFGCGVWDTMHERLGFVDGRHLEFTTLLALSQGVSGLSYYMLVNRDNWYLSPINEWGKIRERFVPAIRRLGKIFKAISRDNVRPVGSVGLVWSGQDRCDFVLSGRCFDHNYFDAGWFGKNRYHAQYKEFWDLYEALWGLGYDVDVIDKDTGECRSAPRILIFPVTPRWNSSCEDFARAHLARGGSLILAGDKADQTVLKFPPSIGTPVQRWVRDLPWREISKIGDLLAEMGEKPQRRVAGQNIRQFLRVNARGEHFLFVFSLADRPQRVEVLQGPLREIVSGRVFRRSQSFELPEKSGRVFRIPPAR